MTYIIFSGGRKPVGKWSETILSDRSETPVGNGGYIYTPLYFPTGGVFPNRQGMGNLVFDHFSLSGLAQSTLDVFESICIISFESDALTPRVGDQREQDKCSDQIIAGRESRGWPNISAISFPKTLLAARKEEKDGNPSDYSPRRFKSFHSHHFKTNCKTCIQNANTCRQYMPTNPRQGVS